MRKIMIGISLYIFSIFPCGEKLFAHVNTRFSRQKTINIKDYFVANQYLLKPAIEGLEGKIELLQDKAFKKWKNPGRRDEGIPPEGADYADKFKSALLRLVSKEGQVLDTINLLSIWEDEAVWVTLGREDVYGTGRLSYFVVLDHNIGSGVGGGEFRRYFDVVNGNIVWFKAKEKITGKFSTFGLGNAMMTLWKSVPSPKGKGKIFLQRWVEYPGRGNGITHYERYEFNGHEWIKYEKIRHEAVDSETELPGIEAFH